MIKNVQAKTFEAPCIRRNKIFMYLFIQLFESLHFLYFFNFKDSPKVFKLNWAGFFGF